MAKQIVRVAKLEFNAGQAKPGPELAGLGIVMPEFTKQFNDQTRDRGSEPVPVEITIYKDRSFTCKLFTAPAAYKLIQAAKIQKGSPNAKTTIAGTITVKQLQEIAEYKLVDLNTDNVKQAMKIIAGTAKNMGIAIEGWDDIEKLKADAIEAQKAEARAHAMEEKLAEEIKAASEHKEFVEAEVIKKPTESNEENGDK